MGHDPLEVALDRHLFNEAPAAIGIGLKTKRSLVNTALPTQAIGRINQQGPFQRWGFLRQLQHRADQRRQRRRPRPHRQSLGNRSGCWRPDLPLRRVGDKGINADGSPAHGRPFGGLKTGVGAGNLPSQGLRWVRHRTPPHLCSVGRPTAAIGVTDLQWLTCTDEIQRRRLRT